MLVSLGTSVEGIISSQAFSSPLERQNHTTIGGSLDALPTGEYFHFTLVFFGTAVCGFISISSLCRGSSPFAPDLRRRRNSTTTPAARTTNNRLPAVEAA